MKHWSLLLFSILIMNTLMAQETTTSEIPDDATKINPLLIGEDLPDAELETVEGVSVSLKELSNEKTTVLIFYRGGWCPYCTTQLADLNDLGEETENLDFQIIGISPDTPEKLAKTEEDKDISYTLLSDPKLELAQKLGIAFKVDEETSKRYEKYGIELVQSPDGENFQLPAPAVFVIDKEGVVQFNYVNPNYKVRLAKSILLAVLKSVK